MFLCIILIHKNFQKIPPLGNTTFNVVFLGREEGSIESSLYIHTTEGHLKYQVNMRIMNLSLFFIHNFQVKGASVFSPYRLRPIVGIKLPINTSFSPLIYMHNPHVEPIQVNFYFHLFHSLILSVLKTIFIFRLWKYIVVVGIFT